MSGQLVVLLQYKWSNMSKPSGMSQRSWNSKKLSVITNSPNILSVFNKKPSGTWLALYLHIGAGGNGLAALVLAGPVFLKVKMKSIFTKSK